MTHGMWIGTVMLVGGLIGLRRGWRRQMADAGGCVAALVLARWQYPRLVPYVQSVCPALGRAAGQVALVYLFVVLYGLLHVLVAPYVPYDPRTASRHWLAGLLGAAQSALLATLALALLP